MPVDTSNMLKKVLEDFRVTTGRAVTECTANSMKVPNFLNIPFAHPFVRKYFYLCLATGDNPGHQS